MLSNAAFYCTKCAGPTVAPTGTICIISVCMTTRMNPSAQSAQPCGSLYSVGITTAYFWTRGRNIHCWVFLHILEKVDIDFPVGRLFWHWMIWIGRVQWKYNRRKEGTRPCKVLSKSLSVYWTLMLWDSGMIPRLASVYSILQSNPRCSSDVAQQNGWW